MVRLNKNLLSEGQLEKLFKQLNTTLGALSTTDTNLMLSELLGKEERIMLAKRLAAIILILEGNSLYKTAAVLKLSPATAKTIKYKIDTGEFNNLIHFLGKNKVEYFSILETLDSILHLGGILPHYNGLDRYKGL